MANWYTRLRERRYLDMRAHEGPLSLRMRHGILVDRSVAALPKAVDLRKLRRAGRVSHSLSESDWPERFSCSYCGGMATTWDHFEPKSKGGSNSQSDNLVPCCLVCNALKADHTATIFMAKQRAFRQFQIECAFSPINNSI